MAFIDTKPQEGTVVIEIERHGTMLLPLGDGATIVKVDPSTKLVWRAGKSLEGSEVWIVFRDGRSPFADANMVIKHDVEQKPVVNGGLFAYDVILTKANAVTEVFRAGGIIDAKPRPG